MPVRMRVFVDSGVADLQQAFAAEQTGDGEKSLLSRTLALLFAQGGRSQSSDKHPQSVSLAAFEALAAAEACLALNDSKRIEIEFHPTLRVSRAAHVAVLDAHFLLLFARPLVARALTPNERVRELANSHLAFSSLSIEPLDSASTSDPHPVLVAVYASQQVYVDGTLEKKTKRAVLHSTLLTPFTLAMVYGCADAAMHLVSCGARIHLPALATHLNIYGWSAPIQSIADAFSAQALKDASLWQYRDSFDNASFIEMLARTYPFICEDEEKRSVTAQSLYPFMTAFYAAYPDCVSGAREPILTLILRNKNELLFGWLRNLPLSVSQKRVSDYDLAALVSDGRHDVLLWNWGNGESIVEKSRMFNSFWYEDAGHPSANQFRKLLPNHLIHVVSEDLSEDVNPHEISIYGYGPLHLAIRHAQTVQFLVDVCGVDAGQILKAKHKHKPLQFSLNAVELSLCLGADESTKYLLSKIPTGAVANPRDAYISVRVTALNKELRIKAEEVTQKCVRYSDAEMGRLEDWIRFLAIHSPSTARILQHHICDLPFLLRSLRIPAQRIQYLFETPISPVSASEEVHPFQLLPLPPFDPNGALLSKGSKIGSLLHIAINKGDVALVRMLILMGADLSAVDFACNTALHLWIIRRGTGFEAKDGWMHVVAGQDDIFACSEVVDGMMRDAFVPLREHRNADGVSVALLCLLVKVVCETVERRDSLQMIPMNEGALHNCLLRMEHGLDYWHLRDGGALHALARVFIQIASTVKRGGADDDGSTFPRGTDFGLRLSHGLEAVCAMRGILGTSLEVNRQNENGETALDVLTSGVRELRTKETSSWEELARLTRDLKEKFGMKHSVVQNDEFLFQNNKSLHTALPAKGLAPVNTVSTKTMPPTSCNKYRSYAAAPAVRKATSGEDSHFGGFAFRFRGKDGTIQELPPTPLPDSPTILRVPLPSRPAKHASDMQGQKRQKLSIKESHRHLEELLKHKKKEFMKSFLTFAEDERAELCRFQNDAGNTLIHAMSRFSMYLANETSSNSTDAESPPWKKEFGKQGLAQRQALRDFFRKVCRHTSLPDLSRLNNQGLSPLTISVLRDFFIGKGSKSVITQVLQELQATFGGVNSKGMNACHGVIEAWIAQISGKEVIGKMGKESYPALVLVKVVCTLMKFNGVDPNLVDDREMTPLDLFYKYRSIIDAEEWSIAVGLFRELRLKRREELLTINSKNSKRKVESPVTVLSDDEFQHDGNSSLNVPTPLLPTLNAHAMSIQNALSSGSKKVAEFFERTSGLAGSVNFDFKAQASKLFSGSAQVSVRLIEDAFAELSADQVSKLVSFQDSVRGDSAIHFLARSITHRRAVESFSFSELTLISQVALYVTRTSNLNVRNRISLTPLALSILEDSAHLIGPNGNINDVALPPASVITVILKQRGCTLGTLDSRGRNAVHGAVLFWIQAASEGRLIKAISVASSILYFKKEGCDARLKDSTGCTPADILKNAAFAEVTMDGKPVVDSSLEHERDLLLAIFFKK
ncbi:hypothetical protein BC830DRAFT_1164261 [Chytriomyces sp. MP71]|nr:hypothetical protein BC830DRAFT_1164261 [Chytriomyces sp. MP71]